MPKIIALIIAFTVSITVSAQENKEKTLEIKKGVDGVFNRLHKEDSTLIKKAIYKEVKIETTTSNKFFGRYTQVR